ncbi:hypothetical protein T440DRAFT_493570 [Plenodomus tracheiphilus IPT5]|uniref:UBC core domain-containing protein n=1 Tax=Plenodomus tracheiphilus IPT5 TaxID=1408161 RepID=A0A6A7APK2_9PLEO|nr:hypothetical protein T440DRAFT_493570 [Plenodomus tracheiphilus IPT5]
MLTSQSINVPGSLRRRLLSDIAEIQQDPYPNVHLHFDDTDIYQACLILKPDNEAPLHLSIRIPDSYPLVAPHVDIQSSIVHPNVFGSYICATILNNVEDWTPAYTLRGIVIQLLSFFCSESLEQDHGGTAVNIADYRRRVREHESTTTYICSKCGFDDEWEPAHSRLSATAVISEPPLKLSGLFELPDEVVLLLLAQMPTPDIMALANAMPTIKTMVYSYDLVRIRELQCFCLKRSFHDVKLGIGIAVQGGRKPVFRSEFDLLSQEAFFQHNVHKSIQGVHFDKWLPLPLSRRHWNRVKGTAMACLESMERCAGVPRTPAGHAEILYHFMNTVVVQFSAEAEKGFDRPGSRSTLSHASEKAVEAYFTLFHLLLCLATENADITASANRIIARFRAGPRTKEEFPDLGHVLVAALISDSGLTEDLTVHMIKEAILRNVVWMLDTKGAGMAELAYLEPSAVSEYRLCMTFRASPTSYRLLMFLKLFSSAVRPPNRTLPDLCDKLFDTHGAPPPGTAASMAQRIREIRHINSFPGFLGAMGIKCIPSKSEFTAFLRRTITDSAKAGYSRTPLTPAQLYMIRKAREPEWFERGEKWYGNGYKGRPSFFPTPSHRKGSRMNGDAFQGERNGRRHIARRYL